ncbi:MAG TPA: hypothetical protein VIM42_05030, partial [Clostridium sp.]
MDNNLDNFFVKLPNDIYDDLSVSNEELTVLVLLYRNYQLYKSVGVCSLDMITKIMRVNVSNNRQIIPTLKEAISGLIKKEYITGLYDLSYQDISVDDISKDSIFYVELVAPPEERYFVIYDVEINHIFNQLESKKLSKSSLIRYFIACRRVSHNESNFGYLSQTKLKQLLSDSKTISNYNVILQDELHLIRYNNSFLTPDKHYCTTFIGQYNDEKNFNYQLQIQVAEQKLMPTNKVTSNKKRSKKQEINNTVDIQELEEKQVEYAELEYKDNLVDIRSFAEIKGRGLQNNKNHFEDTYELTDEEQELNQECINLNNDQIPEDI